MTIEKLREFIKDETERATADRNAQLALLGTAVYSQRKNSQGVNSTNSAIYLPIQEIERLDLRLYNLSTCGKLIDETEKLEKQSSVRSGCNCYHGEYCQICEPHNLQTVLPPAMKESK